MMNNTANDKPTVYVSDTLVQVPQCTAGSCEIEFVFDVCTGEEGPLLGTADNYHVQLSALGLVPRMVQRSGEAQAKRFVDNVDFGARVVKANNQNVDSPTAF